MNILNLFFVVICFCVSLNAQTYKFTYTEHEDSVAIVTESLDMGNTQESAEREKYRRNHIEWKTVYYRNGQSRVQFDSIIHKDKNYKKSKRVSSESYTQYFDFIKKKVYFTDDSVAPNKIAKKIMVNKKWDFSDKTIYEVNHLKCRKAKLEDSRDECFAWYSIDIPIDCGFYQYTGLPGLIVKITQRDRYVCNLVKIEQLNNSVEIIPLKTRTFIPHEEFQVNFENHVLQRLALQPRPRK